MLLDDYDKQGLLTITSVLGVTSTKGISAFRGNLVLKEGELRKGKETDRKPPELVLHEAAVLADDSKLIFVNGLFKEVEDIAVFAKKYQSAITPDTLVLCYVENIDAPMQIVLNDIDYLCEPYKEGMVWNETLELLYIEKADLKGQSAEDKVVTLYDAAKQFKSKGSAVSFDEALTRTIVVKKDLAAGPV
jgi:hypothetical protein